MQKLSRDFFNRNVVEVARDLLGQYLVFGQFQGLITETEAYRGADDPASHAFTKTPRSEIMYGEPGFSYVYLIYGMYHCLNVVTETKGSPSAVLIRGIRLVQPENILLDGPGKLCRKLEINLSQSKIDMIENEHFYFAQGHQVVNFDSTPRIGITKATDKLWRFVAK